MSTSHHRQKLKAYITTYGRIETAASRRRRAALESVGLRRLRWARLRGWVDEAAGPGLGAEGLAVLLGEDPALGGVGDEEPSVSEAADAIVGVLGCEVLAGGEEEVAVAGEIGAGCCSPDDAGGSCA